MPLREIRRGLLVLGITVLIAAPALSLGSIWSRRRHITEFKEAAFSPAVLADTAMRSTVVYHLSRYQAEDAMIWTLRGDATLGVMGTVAGLILLVTSLRRRA